MSAWIDNTDRLIGGNSFSGNTMLMAHTVAMTNIVMDFVTWHGYRFSYQPSWRKGIFFSKIRVKQKLCFKYSSLAWITWHFVAMFLNFLCLLFVCFCWAISILYQYLYGSFKKVFPNSFFNWAFTQEGLKVPYNEPMRAYQFMKFLASKSKSYQCEIWPLGHHC